MHKLKLGFKIEKEMRKYITNIIKNYISRFKYNQYISMLGTHNLYVTVRKQGIRESNQIKRKAST